MFEKINGQDKVVALLSADLMSGRIADSYIFTGPLNSGKEAMALEFAKVVNCTGSKATSLIPEPVSTPCGNCASCRKISSGQHPDVFVLNFSSQGELLELKADQKLKQKELKVEAVRMLISRAYMSPLEAKKKVFVIDGAENLNRESSNALLKVLEESPKQCHWILLALSSERVLTTIRSRCRKIAFAPLMEKEALLEQEPLDSVLASIADEVLPGRKALTVHPLTLSQKVLADKKKVNTRIRAEQFLKVLAAKSRENLMQNPTIEQAESLSKVLDALEDLKRNVGPQLVLDSLAVSFHSKAKSNHYP